jgi:inorganic pyrophosphatase
MPEEFIHCVVEIPKGSRNKYEWDPELKAIREPYDALEDLPQQMRDEIEHFFSI